MLKGLDAYGSDDSDSELSNQAQDKSTTERTIGTSKSLLSLPSPVNSAKPRPRRAVFTVIKPSKSPTLDKEEREEEERPAKKKKLESKSRTGTSSLLAMLPAPSKRTLPISTKLTENISSTIISNDSSDKDIIPDYRKADSDSSLIPASLLSSNAKTKAATAQSNVNFFSLESTHTPVKQTLPTLSSTSASISSAPDVPTFEPPEPTPQDPYPGYYQLPSGEWAAYDRDHYIKYYNSWAVEFQQRETGLEEAEFDKALQVDVHAQLDSARKEQEERKALTKNAGGGPSAPRMNITAAKAGSLAKTRHQLSTLLTDAYENREALEERIAQAKRNRKESGNKYGF